MKAHLTAQRLRELLSYEPTTGHFTWLASPSKNVKAGDVAGSLDHDGYVRIGIDRQSHVAHRLAFLYMTGEWPKFEGDHEDGDGSNNRFSNLRDISHMHNTQNQRRAQRSNRSCGLLGVSRNRGRWAAHIRVDGKKRHLGTHDTPELAHQAYVNAKRALHPGCTI